MKNSVVLLIVFVGLCTRCGEPPRKRRNLVESPGLSSADNYNYREPDNDDTNDTKETEDETVEETQIPEGIKHCKWAINGSSQLEKSHKHFSPGEESSSQGNYTLCQSQNDEKDIYIQLKHPLSDEICLFPVNIIGTTVKQIGQARCLYIENPDTIYKVEVFKDHFHNKNLPINGILAMRKKSYPYPAPYGRSVFTHRVYRDCDHGHGPSCRAFKSMGKYILHSFYQVKTPGL